MFLLVTNPEITSQVEKQMNIFQRFWFAIDWDKFLATTISKTIAFIITAAAFFIIYHLGKIILHRSFKKYAKANFSDEVRTMTIKKLTESIFQYTILFFFIYTLLSILGVPVGSLIAGAGIAGVALGLGAQGFMNDLISGMFIFIERQFDIGNKIKFQGNGIILEGTVIAIGIRSTRIKGLDGSIHFIPNRNIVMVTNYSRSEIKTILDFQILSNQDIKLAEKLIIEANHQLNAQFSQLLTQPVEFLGISYSPTSHLVIRSAIFSKTEDVANLSAEFYKTYLEAFQKTGIAMPENSLR
ncbi:MAG: mechanosensitive ion channel family protein [Streptococcaceae bacterium]|jgi:small conductance mechanosensitive channel|nr:mechanosensitive ion channel family protein [Streptococcaceae bacterium]